MWKWFRNFWNPSDPEKVVTFDIEVEPTEEEKLHDFDRRFSEFKRERSLDERVNFGASIDMDSL